MNSQITQKPASNVLPIAALFQDEFTIDWLVELADGSVRDVLRELQEGVQQKWLSTENIGLYRFANLKKKDELARGLDNELRIELHQKIIDLILQERMPEDTEALAVSYHMLEIPNDEKNCRRLAMAGDLHGRLYATDMALKCYRKVLDDLAEQHGESVDNIFVETAISYSRISTAKHDTRIVISLLAQALKRAQKNKNNVHQALIELHLAKNEWLRSGHQKALEHFEKGRRLAGSLDNPRLARTVKAFSTFFLYWQGRFRDAVEAYEDMVPDVERYPNSGFPLLAAVLVGRCYGLTGQVTQGLGMLDAIRLHAQKVGNRFMASHATYSMGGTMLDIRKVDDALQYLKTGLNEASKGAADWVRINGNIMLAYASYLKGDSERATHYLKEYLTTANQLQVTVLPYQYIFELAWAIHRGHLPKVKGLAIDGIMRKMIEGNNVFTKGVAYRYQALMLQERGRPQKEILESLCHSRSYLKKSGHQMELVQTKIELSRQYLLAGDQEQARACAKPAVQILSKINEELIPKDLQNLLENSHDQTGLLSEIFKLGQEVVTLKDPKELAREIISTVNRLTKAERGAIFVGKDGTSKHPRLWLRASKNITSEQIEQPSFEASMKMIHEVFASGKGRISGREESEDLGSLSMDAIRSRICIPMVLRNKVVGVLYHDNRLLSNAFRLTDMGLLGYFAALAAIAMSNAQSFEEIKKLNRKLDQEKSYYQEAERQNLHFEEIIGESPAINKMLKQIEQVAGTDTSVLIWGETGVGKELVARAIHRHSQRSKKPFVRSFIGSLPHELIPSDLFGHEKGSFTGATHQRVGKFELADSGTLFLDEIGELPLDVQVILLRVLQTKEFERVGGECCLNSDFRLISATNRDLNQGVKQGLFRSDLFYRLNVFPIKVPPLRERKSDIPLLAYHFLNRFSTNTGKKFGGISNSEIEKMMEYEWPGNVRELENIIERATVLSNEPNFRLPDLGIEHTGSLSASADHSLQANERRHILWALEKTNWNVAGKGGAAELLVINPSTLSYRMKKLGIIRPNKNHRGGHHSNATGSG